MLLTCMTRAPSVSRHAWLVVALLMPVALLNYLDRQMLASMKSSVMRDIPDIALEANWGFMLGQFKWVYAVLSPVGGYLADRSRRRHVSLAACWCGRRSRGDRPRDDLRELLARARSWASARRSTFPPRWP